MGACVRPYCTCACARMRVTGMRVMTRRVRVGAGRDRLVVQAG